MQSSVDHLFNQNKRWRKFSWDVAAGIFGLASTGALGWWMISRVRGSVC